MIVTIKDSMSCYHIWSQSSLSGAWYNRYHKLIAIRPALPLFTYSDTMIDKIEYWREKHIQDMSFLLTNMAPWAVYWKMVDWPPHNVKNKKTIFLFLYKYEG